MPVSNALPSRSGRWFAVCVGVWFIGCRLPVMYLQPGGQDEDIYAVPGLTILQSGIPRLPHVPARNAESVFFRADEAMFCEPPLYFYWQALFYAVLPWMYGTARLSSGVAGLLCVWMVYRLARGFGGSPLAAAWGAGLLVLSRWFYFPALSARPDALAALFGFAAIASVLDWQRNPRLFGLVRTGILIGLGGLAHPFAMVYAVQIAGWLMITALGWQRFLQPLLVAVSSMATASLWLLLIVQYPQAFEVQFRNQFLHSAGGGPLERLLWPWESLVYHAGFMPQHVQLWQLILTTGGLVAATVWSVQRRDRRLQCVCWLTWSAVYLMCVAVGPHHPVWGYWIYPAGLAFVGIGRVVEAVLAAAGRVGDRGRWLARATGAALVLSMLPGGGYRTLLAHWRNWGDADFNAPRFARMLLESVPEQAVCAVDTQFALDFVAAGRPTLLAQTAPYYFRLDQFDFDYLLVSRYGLDTQIATRLPVELIQTLGVRDDGFACYCEIYSRSK